MTKYEMALIVLNNAVAQRKHATAVHIDAVGKLAACQTSSNMWIESDDNVFGRNPYNVEAAQQHVELTKANLEKCEEIITFIMETFIRDAQE